MEQTRTRNIDGGYAWVILAGGIVTSLIDPGTMKAYGVLYTEMLTYYGAGSGNTAWIGSLTMLLMFGMAPFSNWLSVKYTFRKVSFVGGLLVGTGYCLSYLVRRMEMMYLTFGVVAGSGYGLSFCPCTTITSFYFQKHRALANGIQLAGSGAGLFLFPILFKYLIETYGLPGTFLIVGGLTFNICAAACLFVQPEMLRKQKKRGHKSASKTDGQILLDVETECGPQSKSNNHKVQNKSACHSSGPDFKFFVFRNPRFLLYSVSMFFCMGGYTSNMILIPAHVSALGMDKTKVMLSVSIMGGCEVVSRIICGRFADKQYVQRKHIYSFNLLIGSLFAFITPSFGSFTYMAVYAAIVGVFPGSFFSLVAVLVIDVVGIEDFAGAYGLIRLIFALASGLTQPVIGWLDDATGNWHASFYLTGTLFLIASVLVMLEPLVSRFSPEQNREPIGEEMLDKPIKRANLPSAPVRNTSSLLDEENDVSFTSAQISRIYCPVSNEGPLASPELSSAPLVTKSDI